MVTTYTSSVRGLCLLCFSALLAAALGLDAGNNTCVSSAPPDVDAVNRHLLDMMGGTVVTPPSPLNVTVWPGDATMPGFIFPELNSTSAWGIPALQAKPNFGIGVAGGGLRATCLALGWLRGMYKAGLLGKARYLASASGGSMANAMISFSDPAKLRELLGTYVPPKKATIAHLKALTKGSFLDVLAGIRPNFYQAFPEAIYRSRALQLAKDDSAFARTLSLMLYKGLGLGDFNSTTTAKGTRGMDQALAEAARRHNLTAYTVDSNHMPYPLLTGNILVASASDPTNMTFYPIEFTPLYSGSPCNFSHHTYSSSPNGAKKFVGGGLVQNLGFNAHLTEGSARPAQNAGEAVVQVQSDYVQPMVGQVSVSGGLLGVLLQGLIQAYPGPAGTARSEAAGQPVYEMFDFVNYETTKYPFGDGGFTDNVGLIAMLRRKVKKLLLFYAVANPIDDERQWSIDNSGLSLPFGRCEDPTYAALNSASQVFANQSAFDDLFHTYQAKRCKGAINTWRASLEVVENKFLGVPGGWTADVMVVMNAPVAKWEAKLPPKTKALLAKNRNDPESIARARLNPLQTTELVDFPFYNILIFQYDSLAAGALSNMATWQVLQLKKEITDFIGSN